MTTETSDGREATENITGKRVLAAAIDVVVLAIVFAVMSVLFGETETEGSSFEVNLDGGPALLFFLIVMLYYFVPEALTGQTLGKRIMGLRVVALDEPLTWGKVALRTVLRVIDGLPIFYLAGMIAIAVSQKQQRIGDMVAGTRVVRA
jgi:uncharacterized RDD family membrane protein YckC